MNILEKIVILKCFLTCFWTITFRIYVFLRNDNFFPLEPSLHRIWGVQFLELILEEASLKLALFETRYFAERKV